MSRSRISPLTLIVYIVVVGFALLCVLPLVLTITGSISREDDIIKFGYTLFPKHVSLIAYQILFADIMRIARGYAITIFVTMVGTPLSLLVNSMIAYGLAKKSLKYRNILSFYCLFPLLFSGGMVPWYIVCVNMLHLKDKIFALIVPYLVNGWNIFLLRNFIQSIPDEMHESAKIDGAREFTIYSRIILPLAKPALATVGLFTALGYWNDWWLGLMLIDNSNLQPLQMLLRIIESNVDFLRSSPDAIQVAQLYGSMPTEGIKMAMAVITIGPIIFLYPFLQKYFVKGIMIGAVKG